MPATAADVDAAIDDLQSPRVRPSVVQWLRYAITATSPPQCKTWVLHDATCRTWVLRHAARMQMIILPLIVVLEVIFLPLTPEQRLIGTADCYFPSTLGSMLFVIPATERRLIKAGYPHGMGEALRNRLGVDRQRAANYARREKIAAKRNRRLGL